jgi:hypothetical protein
MDLRNLKIRIDLSLQLKQEAIEANGTLLFELPPALAGGKICFLLVWL